MFVLFIFSSFCAAHISQEEASSKQVCIIGIMHHKFKFRISWVPQSRNLSKTGLVA
jgi:hypothetical protein